MNSTGKKIIIGLFIFLCGFSFSHASLEISEVMYNPEGTDTNREWVEVYNNGSAAVDIGSWYFYEGETYHGMHPDNFSSLSSGQRALVVKDVAIAKSELGSGFKYIKSSFALNNTGETLIIANSSKDHIDTYSYSTSSGADGDGNSLQNLNGSWVSADPTPGKQNSSSDNFTSNHSDESNNAGSGNNTDVDKDVIYADPYYVPTLNIPTVIVAQSDFEIKADVEYIRKKRKTRKLKGYFYINFGDGKSIESNERIDQTYRYRNPGNYIIVFEYYSSYLSFENGNSPDSLLKRAIHVTAHDLKIIDVNYFDGVILKNNTNKTIDLTSWKIVWNNKTYSFPRYSFLAADEKTSIQFNTLGFSPKPSSVNPIQLLSNAYRPVSSFPQVFKKKSSVKKKKVEKKDIPDKLLLGTAENDQDLLVSENLDFFGNTNSYLEDYLSDNPNKLKVDFGGNVLSKKDSSGKNNNQKKGSNIYYAFGSLMLMLGIGRFIKHNSTTEVKKEDKDFGTIKVVE